ncbi:MAG: FkbM family methyltransferase [Candidatus Marsarchaeota archaeon]|nr:FkbM family methyltransferase [Candidatus Marsarchaeota archaeon]
MADHTQKNFTIDLWGRLRGFFIIHKYFKGSFAFAMLRLGLIGEASISPRIRTNLESVEAEHGSNIIKVRFKGKNLKFYVDSNEQFDNSMICIFNVFFDDEYCRLDVKGQSVVDIGANVGDSALYFFSNGAKKVYAYEVYPYSCRIARRNVELNHAEGTIEIENKAVLGRSGTIKIDPSYSNITTSQINEHEEGQETEVVTLDQIVKEHGLNNASLKIDCEGSEYEILLNAKASSLRKFKQIILEYHFGPAPIVSRLKDSGFKVEYTRPRSSRRISNCMGVSEKMQIGIIYAHK